MCPHTICAHSKVGTKNQQTSNGKKEMRRAYERSKKQISMIDMASKEMRKQARRKTNGKANKRWCLRGTNVSLDQMSIASLC